MSGSLSKKRILEEAKVNAAQRQERAQIGITLDPVSYENVYKWDARIQFLNEDSPYYEQIYYLTVDLPDDYPQHPPKISFKAQILHPNIEKRSGQLCKNFYHLQQWSTQNTIFSCIIAVQYLINNPVWTDIVNHEAYQLWKTDLLDFKITAQSVCALNPVDFKSKTYKFPIPYTEETQLEESLFLKNQESPKFYFQNHHALQKTKATTGFYNERKCSNFYIKDSMNFVNSGQLDVDIQSIIHRKRYQPTQQQPRLLSAYAGQIEVKTNTSKISQTLVKSKVDLSKANDLFVVSSRPVSQLQSQQTQFRRQNLKSAPLAPFKVPKNTMDSMDLSISQLGSNIKQ